MQPSYVNFVNTVAGDPKESNAPEKNGSLLCLLQHLLEMEEANLEASVEALKGVGPSFVMFMDTDGDNSKEINPLDKNGSLAVPVAVSFRD